jgi:hypothetical protein
VDRSGHDFGADSQGRELSRSAIAVLAAALRKDQDALRAALQLVPAESMATTLGAVSALGLRMGGER